MQTYKFYHIGFFTTEVTAETYDEAWEKSKHEPCDWDDWMQLDQLPDDSTDALLITIDGSPTCQVYNKKEDIDEHHKR